MTPLTLYSVPVETLSLTPLPDAHWVAAQQGQILARCSLWWQKTPALGRHRVGVIGHVNATDGAAAVQLLTTACQELRRQQCTLALGPMDGNTWHPYRCFLDEGTEPPFFLEPQTPAAWASYFTTAGFQLALCYESRLCEDLPQQWVPRSRQRVAVPVVLRTAVGLEPDLLLRQIYPLVMYCFRRQPLFQPVSEDAFYRQYRALFSFLQPELVTLAYDGADLVGLLLAMPDWPVASAPDIAISSAELPPRLILRTLAVRPMRAYAGLGYGLINATHQMGHRLGYRSAIHALMHIGNASRNLSRRYSVPMQRYGLFSQEL